MESLSIRVPIYGIPGYGVLLHHFEESQIQLGVPIYRVPMYHSTSSSPTFCCHNSCRLVSIYGVPIYRVPIYRGSMYMEFIHSTAPPAARRSAGVMRRVPTHVVPTESACVNSQKYTYFCMIHRVGRSPV